MIKITNKYGKVIKIISGNNFTVNVGETVGIKDEHRVISGKVEDIIHLITVDDVDNTIVTANIYEYVIVLNID